NSTWAVAFAAVAIGIIRLLPAFNGPIRLALVVAVVGIAGYLIFLLTVDVPMYLTRWRATVSAGGKLLRQLEGLRAISTRWVVTHEFSEWKEEMTWMALYFSAAVWSSLALCVFYALTSHLAR